MYFYVKGISMKNIILIQVVITSLIANFAQAGTMGAIDPNRHWVGAISAGPVWQSAGVQQTFFLAPEIEKTYTADKINRSLADVELFLGAQYGINSLIATQLGLAVGVTSDATLSGMIWDDADPLFDNYIYQYKIQHTHIAAKGKLLVDNGYWITPWISASIGVGFNNAHGFNNTPLIFEAVPNSNFIARTQTAFTYTAGAGLQKNLNEHWQVGVGYEFADWGKSKLGQADGQTFNTGLTLNHLYTNGFLFNLTYVA